MPPLLSVRSQSFLQISSRVQLAEWLGVSDRALRFVLYKLPDASKYSSFSIKKRNGGSRRIDAPTRGLKSLQAALASSVSEICPARELAKGYVENRSIFDHARVHRSKRWLVLADLEAFFPSINFGRVRGLFLSPPFSFNAEVATCLAQICCKGNELPQGSPASPAISNAICRRLDRELLNLAKKARCRVSRYADDIAFSTNSRLISHEIADFVPGHGYVPGRALRSTVEANGFRLNDAKFKIHRPRERMLVTGLVVNNGISISRAWRRQVRSVLHLVSRLGGDRAAEIVSSWRPAFFRHGARHFEQSLRGKLRHIRWIDRKARRSVINSLFRNYPRARTYLPLIDPKFSIRLMAEGDSDLLHLEAAFKHYYEKGRYQEIKPRFHNFPGDKGDSELWATLQRIAKVDVDELTIGVFDCDSPSLMAKAGLAPGSYVKLGPMVFAVCLAPYEGLTAPYCIENLYPRLEATRWDAEGRRLFFKDEFDDAGTSSCGKFTRSHPKAASIVVSGTVQETLSQKSVLLGKMSFAEKVRAADEPFGNMTFLGFKPTLDLIEELVREVASLRVI